MSGGSWAAGGDLGVSRQYLQGAGFGADALAIGGYQANQKTTEEYNGTAWTAGGSTTYDHGMGGACGSLTAALVLAGYGVLQSEEYDGTSWGAGGDLGSAAHYGHGVGGSQTAAISTGGNYSSQIRNWYWKYDGTTWTYGGTMGATRYVHAATGGMDDQIICNGAGSVAANSTEVYDGVSWSAGVSTNTGGNYCQMVGDPLLAMLTVGTTVDSFDGVAWASENGLTTSRTKQPGMSDASTGIDYISGVQVFGGGVDATEEYTESPPAPVPYYGEVVTPTWETMNPMVNYRRECAGCGTTSAALVFGGYGGSYSTKTDEYDGTSWAQVGDLLDGRTNLRGFGTATAGFCVGGKFGNSSTNVSWATDEFDGTSWAFSDNLNRAFYNGAASGSPSAAICCGGMTNGSTNSLLVDGWDGVAWAALASLSSARSSCTSHGDEAAAICIGGHDGTAIDYGDEFNGTSWSVGDDLLNTLYAQGSAASALDDIIVYGGTDGVDKDSGQHYDGVAWAADADTLDSREWVASAGTASSAIRAGGWLNSSYTATAQEYSLVSTFPNIAGVAIGSTALGKLYLGDTVVYDP